MHTRVSNSELVEPLPEPERNAHKLPWSQSVQRQHYQKNYHGLNEITQEDLNATPGGIFLYKTPNQAYQLLEDKVLLKLDWAENQKTKSSLKKTVAFATEGSSNSDTNKIMARMDAMTMKMDAQYKDFQSCSKQSTLDDDDIPMSREEEARFMQTFRRTRFYNDYRDRDSNLDNQQSSGRNAENMLVEVGKFTFPADFVILEMEEDSKVLLILGRPFLHTADGVIRVKHKQLNLGVGTERLIIHIDFVMKHSYSNDDTIFSIDVIDKILEEDLNALLVEGSEILHSIEGTILEEKVFAEFNEFMAMTADENFESESDTEEPSFKKITFNTDYKIKTSIKEPPTDLELKPLPENLEYVFLEEPSFLPVIISPYLSEEKNKLVSVLKRHKQAYAQKTTDIPGICPSFLLLMKEMNLSQQELLQVGNPNWSLPFELMCNASDFAVEAILGQKEALRHLFKKQDAKSRLIRWILLLQEFDIEIKDRKGTKNVVADHLSRIENEETSDDSEVDDNFPG
ncbi:reverse transcriptase domain-containing protein [Tanacetum coccineum]|uniref:Reverse transcriptase domain-containing protein n=1 Tax=Tanacetum coccineum TaxID=301880 RepID=A0ABQ4YWL3_9ASTR